MKKPELLNMPSKDPSKDKDSARRYSKKWFNGPYSAVASPRILAAHSRAISYIWPSTELGGQRSRYMESTSIS